MKYLPVLFLLLAVRLGAQPPQGWAAYQKDNYVIIHPETWRLDASGQSGTRFLFFAPLENDQDKFQENVNLVIQDVSRYEVDLDKYANIMREQLKTMVQDLEIIESTREQTGLYEYHKMVFTGKINNLDFHFTQYYWVVKQNAYVLSLTTEKDKYEQYKEVGEKMLLSFSFH